MVETPRNNRVALATPAGYLIPLRDDVRLAHSYVFAFTHWLRPEEVEDVPTLQDTAFPFVQVR
jgi:hypothetical protein